MYAKNETEVSHRYLSRLATDLTAEYCLIGGWAVYYTVASAYAKEVGREYLGSRDIDIGLRDVAAFKKANSFILGGLRFESLSFRYVKYLDYDTGRELSKEEATRLPSHSLFHMYIDLLLPVVNTDTTEQLGFTPPDEPLLTKLFQENGFSRKVPIGDLIVTMPTPALLLAMKLHSVGNRGMDDKRVKDVCDIAALCLYSGEKLAIVIENALSLCDAGKIRKAASQVTRTDVAQAAIATGIQVDTVSALMGRLGVLAAGHGQGNWPHNS
jgi:hypothetical protein